MHNFRIFLLLLGAIIGCNGFAQELHPAVQSTVDACLKMRQGIMGSEAMLREGSKLLKTADPKFWSKLRREDAEPSLDGHYIFDSEFADSLIANRAVYKFAQQYSKRQQKRAKASEKALVYLRNVMIPAKSTVKYTLTGKGEKNIAVVTEPNGMVSIKVKVKDGPVYKSKTNENKGEPYRYEIVKLSDNKQQTLYLEIRNTTDRDISVAIIGN